MISPQVQKVEREVRRFAADQTIESAETPPSSWYTDPDFLKIEKRAIFTQNWQPVARIDQFQEIGSYVSGCEFGQPYVVLKDPHGNLKAYFNVCRHHASEIVKGCGQVEKLECPYHGWTYNLNGELTKAPEVGPLKGFNRKDFGLKPMRIETWGPFVFVTSNLSLPALSRQLGGLSEKLAFCSGDLRFHSRKSFRVNCNWKVYMDNYLDGGYHVPQLHKNLSSQLDTREYQIQVEDRYSLQSCPAGVDGTQDQTTVDFADRIGKGAEYAFVYPNFTINRYGPMMDTNWVLPIDERTCLTIFDYYFEKSVAEDQGFIKRAIEASDLVQDEDIMICESVQRGLESAGFDQSRYAPMHETPAFRFHQELSKELLKALEN